MLISISSRKDRSVMMCVFQFEVVRYARYGGSRYLLPVIMLRAGKVDRCMQQAGTATTTTTNLPLESNYFTQQSVLINEAIFLWLPLRKDALCRKSKPSLNIIIVLLINLIVIQ